MPKSNAFLRRSGRAVSVLLAVLAAACGGDGGPSAPPVVEPPPSPKSMSLSDSSATSMEVVIVGVSGVTLTGETVAGTLGATQVTASRLSDTTMAVLVPTIAAGTHELRFVVGASSFTAPLTVSAAPVVADPAAYFDSIFVASDAAIARLQARLDSGADTVGTHALLTRMRVGVDSARKLLVAMPAAERAKVASYLRANAPAPAVAASAAGWNLGATREVLDCTGFKDMGDCQVEAKRTWVNINIEISACTLTAMKFAAGGVIIGGILGAGAFSIPGAALGAAAGFALGVGLCVDDVVSDMAKEKIYTPIGNLFSAEQLNRASFATMAGAAPPRYEVDVAKQVLVTGELRSVIASDVSGTGPGADIARTIAESGSLWAKLMKAAKMSLPGPVLPATPARRVLAPMPASLLTIGAISVPGATATVSGGDTTFFVTFRNEKQGVDHPLSFAVRYSPAGGAVQERVLGSTLDPKLFRVRTLAVDSVPAELTEQARAALFWTARDSNGVVIDSSRIEGRKPAWTTGNASRATVNGDGVVTGVDTGTVTITATLEGVAAPATIRVIESIVGTYTAFEINGKVVPYTEDDSTGTTTVHGGTITLRADSTFSYSYQESYRNKFTGITYPDEGGSGSGRYVPTGSSVKFTVINKTGDVEPIGTAGISGGVMAATYSGGGSGRLRKS